MKSWDKITEDMNKYEGISDMWDENEDIVLYSKLNLEMKKEKVLNSWKLYLSTEVASDQGKWGNPIIITSAYVELDILTANLQIFIYISLS